MNNIYIFSQNAFNIEFNNQQFNINKNQSLKILHGQDCQNVLVKNINGEFNLNLTSQTPSNFYKCWNYNNDIFYEIITTSYNCLLEKFATKNCEVFVFDNAAKIIYQNKCYFYYYNCSTPSDFLEDDNCLYIFNQNNLLIFDKTSLTFNLLKVKNHQKNNKNIEILCNFPKNIEYFLYFLFNLANSNITTKKLCKGEINKNVPLEYLIFYLCKNNFEEVKKYISNNLEFSSLCEYFKKFDNIVCIQNKYYLYNSAEIVEANFKTENNIVVDID